MYLCSRSVSRVCGVLLGSVSVAIHHPLPLPLWLWPASGPCAIAQVPSAIWAHIGWYSGFITSRLGSQHSSCVLGTYAPSQLEM